MCTPHTIKKEMFQKNKQIQTATIRKQMKTRIRIRIIRIELAKQPLFASNAMACLQMGPSDGPISKALAVQATEQSLAPQHPCKGRAKTYVCRVPVQGRQKQEFTGWPGGPAELISSKVRE